MFTFRITKNSHNFWGVLFKVFDNYNSIYVKNYPNLIQYTNGIITTPQ